MRKITTSLISVKRITLNREQEGYCIPNKMLKKIVNSLLKLRESAQHLYVKEIGRDEEGFSLYELAFNIKEQITLLKAFKIACKENLKDFEVVPCIRVKYQNEALEFVDIEKEVKEQIENLIIPE